MTDLTRKSAPEPVQWTELCQEVFEAVRKALCGRATLTRPPNFKLLVSSRLMHWPAGGWARLVPGGGGGPGPPGAGPQPRAEAQHRGEGASGYEAGSGRAPHYPLLGALLTLCLNLQRLHRPPRPSPAGPSLHSGLGSRWLIGRGHGRWGLNPFPACQSKVGGGGEYVVWALWWHCAGCKQGGGAAQRGDKRSCGWWA